MNTICFSPDLEVMAQRLVEKHLSSAFATDSLEQEPVDLITSAESNRGSTPVFQCMFWTAQWDRIIWPR